jgi:hypothetical protein
MSNEGYTFNIWPLKRGEVSTEIKALNIDCKEQILLVVTNISGIKGKPGVGLNRSERFETLNSKYDTYGYPIPNCDKVKSLMLTREIGTNHYLLLGLSDEENPRERAYQLACKAHNLNNPTRQKNEDN